MQVDAYNWNLNENLRNNSLKDEGKDRVLTLKVLVLKMTFLFFDSEFWSDKLMRYCEYVNRNIIRLF